MEDRSVLKYYDCHVHTRNSHDSVQEAPEIVSGMLAAGIHGLSVTDHLDTRPGEDHGFADNIGGSFAFWRDELKPLAAAEGLEVFFGVELGDGIRNPEFALNFPGKYPFDLLLGSVHKIYLDGEDLELCDVPYAALPQETRRRIVLKYYEDLLLTASTLEFNVLSHLTLIDRYNGYPETSDLFDTEFRDLVNAVLDTVIKRGIALEINSKGIENGRLMPDKYIIEEYFKKGGRLVTTGSDAHWGIHIGRGFRETTELLREIGFEAVFFFKNRVPFENPIEVWYNKCV